MIDITESVVLYGLAAIYAYFALPTLVPGFALYLYAKKIMSIRPAMALSFVLTLAWGVWPVILYPPQGALAGDLLFYWFMPLAQIMDLAAWKPVSIFTVLSVLSVIGTVCLAGLSIRRESGRCLFAAYLALLVYWSVCFGLFAPAL